MNKEFLNKLNNPSSRMSSMFVTLEEEEFADNLKKAGWSEDSIEKELEELRNFKKIFKLEDKKEEELVDEKDSDLVAALMRVKRKRQ